MFRLTSEAELLSAFRQRDRAEVKLPAGRSFPITALDYFSWPEDGGERLYLLFKAPGEKHVTGIVFRKDKATAVKTARICNWCHSHGGADQIGLLSCEASSRRQVGVLLCQDLGCGARVEDDANRKGRSARDAIAALLLRMSEFAREGLGITQDNRNA